MKNENFEKRKTENKRIRRDEKLDKKDKKDLFDFESLKTNLKKYSIYLLWIIVILIISFGFFKIIKWGEIFNNNYIAYSIKKEDKILPILIGERKLSEDEISNIKNFESKLNKIKIKTISVQISTSTDTFIYNVEDINSSNFSIKTNFDKNIEDAWNLLVSVYFSDDIKNLEKNKLEYIDIRYTSKVFYKLKSDKKLNASNIDTNKTIATSTESASN